MKKIFSTSRKNSTIFLILAVIFCALIGYHSHNNKEHDNKEHSGKLVALSNSCERDPQICGEMIYAYKAECFEKKVGYYCFKLSEHAEKKDIYFNGIKQSEISLRTLGCAYGYQVSCSSDFYFKMDIKRLEDLQKCLDDNSKCKEIKSFLQDQCSANIGGSCYELASLMKEAKLDEVSFRNKKITDPQELLRQSCLLANMLSCGNWKK
jgi:hypothetical protein